MTVLARVGLAVVVTAAAELYLVLRIGQTIGYSVTLLLLFGVSFAGTALVRRQVVGSIQRLRTGLPVGTLPGREVADRALAVLGGLLVVVPGFLTDAVGLLLLLPPVRGLVRRIVGGRLALRVAGWQWAGGRGRVVDVQPGWQQPLPPRPLPRAGADEPVGPEER
jgi:UPF0716 protein FxsA